jgi:hypothetical protein
MRSVFNIKPVPFINKILIYLACLTNASRFFSAAAAAKVVFSTYLSVLQTENGYMPTNDAGWYKFT